MLPTPLAPILLALLLGDPLPADARRALQLTPATGDAFWAGLEDRLRSRFFDAVSEYNTNDSDPADEPPAQAD